MKKFFTFFVLLFFIFSFSQELVLIQFVDKPSATTYFNNPLLMLSQKSLDRRIKYNINLTLSDIPVEDSYVQQIQNLGVSIIAKTKWFNGVVCYLSEEQKNQIQNMSFVQDIDSFVRQNGYGKEVKTQDFIQNSTMSFNYGSAQIQTEQIHLDYLHTQNFTGSGITIAMFDSNFPGVDTLPAFAHLRDNNHIKGTYNFVTNSTEVYSGHNHGTITLSTIAGYIENSFVGTAIDADFYLFSTEDVSQEIPEEMVYWVEAAEKADELGVDIISSSLGYSTFDNPIYNYTQEDLDGNTSYISKGAQIAAEKGIMVVNSAGNSGTETWHKINFPADAPDVFTIGAVTENGESSSFSSYGPTADFRVKPDVSALGTAASAINNSGTVAVYNGTSLSAPIISGAMACLMQAFPNELPSVLRQKVRASANYFVNPGEQIGYGIPDFEQVLEQMKTEDFKSSKPEIYPNPVKNKLFISNSEVKSVEVFSLEGIKLLSNKNSLEIDLSSLFKGTYVVKITDNTGKIYNNKVIKE